MKDASEVIDILEKNLGELRREKGWNTLKNSVKKSDIQAKNLKKELEAEHKVIKENEKMIQKLDQK